MSERQPSGRTVEECLSAVCDYETFRDFIWTLIDEREAAQEMEQSDPKWRFGGANGWQNGTISSYLSAAMHHFEIEQGAIAKQGPTWRDLAEFLYTGKVYE